MAFVALVLISLSLALFMEFRVVRQFARLVRANARSLASHSHKDDTL